MTDETAKRIAALNDDFRSRCGMPVFGTQAVPGQFVYTHGIKTLPPETQVAIWAKVRDFSAFTRRNDPYGEHDMGSFDVEGVPEKIFWKIDYYADASCSYGAEEPSDPARCFRILTIMLASEY